MHITISKTLIREILELNMCETQIYHHKAHPSIEGYNSSDACRHVTGKDFENINKTSTHHLSLPCKVLQHIIAHVILPRKGYRDEVNFLDLFILDSFLVNRKLDFPALVIETMEHVHTSRKIKALPYGVLLTKIFKHFHVSLDNEPFVKSRPIDTINIKIFARMRITKENSQWVVHTKGFDPTLGPSTLAFEGDDEDDFNDAQIPPSDILSSSGPRPSSRGNSMTKDQFNIFNGRINSLTSTINSFGSLLLQLQAQQMTIQDRRAKIQAQ